MSPERIVIDSQIHFFEFVPGKKILKSRPESISINNLTLDIKSRWITLNEERIVIQGAALDLLYFLMIKKGEPVSHEEAFKEIFPDRVYTFKDSYIGIYVSFLRKKLGRSVILTTWKDGYKINTSYGRGVKGKYLQVA